MFSRKEAAPTVPTSVLPQVAASTPAAPQNVVQPDGFIGAQITIKGDIHYEGDLRLQGRIIGNVIAVGESSSTLHIENGAEINGNVTVHTVKIDGFVAGSIDSSELVEVTSTGEVSGPIKYNRLAIEAGAIIDGQLTPADGSEGSTIVEQEELSPVYETAQ